MPPKPAPTMTTFTRPSDMRLSSRVNLVAQRNQPPIVQAQKGGSFPRPYADGFCGPTSA
jgi:hypothetical protein